MGGLAVHGHAGAPVFGPRVVDDGIRVLNKQVIGCGTSASLNGVHRTSAVVNANSSTTRAQTDTRVD